MQSSPVRWSAASRRTTEQPINYFIQQALENPRLISLAAGLVDPLSLPADDLAAATAFVLGQPDRAQAALQYGTTHGYPPLREKLLTHIAALDGATPAELALTADDVVLTTGSQQLLYLVAELLFDPGDIIITEAPSYFVYQSALNTFGVQTRTVPMDEDGMNTDALADLLAHMERTGELARLKLIYVCDYFQNPTGRTLSLPRRRQLLELAERYSKHQRIFILEDAAYRELRYDGADVPSIKSLDRDNRHVLLAMTFSKPCAPGLKTGYGVLPRELVAPLLRLKGNHDFGSCNLTQHVLDRLLETGAYGRHVDKLRQVYREKRDALLNALAAEFGSDTTSQVRWTHPEGGLYVWLMFAPEVHTGPDSPLMQAALREGVLYVPGRCCYVGTDVPDHEARLSFGVVPRAQIGEAVRRLARAVQHQREAPARETVASALALPTDATGLHS
jgi:2-aminoadipate transaminase